MKMEKSEFRLLITREFYFWVKKTTPKPKQNLINIMETLHQQFPWLRSGLRSSVGVVSAQVTPNVQLVQRRIVVKIHAMMLDE